MAQSIVDFGEIQEKLNLIPTLFTEIRELKEQIKCGNARTEYMEYEDAAQYLHIGLTTLQQYVCEKKIPHYKLGSCVLFVRTEIDTWMQERRIAEMSNRLDTLKEGMQNRDGPRKTRGKP